MTANELGAIAGVILSLAVAYLPKVKDWYGAKDAGAKAQVMGALLVLSALGAFGLSCVNAYTLVPCTVGGAQDLLSVLIDALVANQATFLIAVKPFKAEG